MSPNTITRSAVGAAIGPSSSPPQPVPARRTASRQTARLDRRGHERIVCGRWAAGRLRRRGHGLPMIGAPPRPAGCRAGSNAARVSTMTTTAPRVRTTYARRLGLFDGTMVVVGGIIGAGIFLNPAIVAQRVGSPGLILAAWALGGAVALLGALCFAELGARRPEAGGGYVYLRETLGPLPAFLYGWTLLLVINSGGIAAVGMTFASYAADLA